MSLSGKRYGTRSGIVKLHPRKRLSSKIQQNLVDMGNAAVVILWHKQNGHRGVLYAAAINDVANVM
jgi:hypothetical protein